MPDTVAYIVMSRAPIPGRTKTRLMPCLLGEEARLVHTFMLNKITQVVGSLEGKHYLFYTGGSTVDFRGLIPENFTFRLQQGRDLGERMADAFVHVFQAGAGKVIMVGSDIPLLGAGHFREALTRLEHADLVLGPNFDGGYYLIGMKEYRPQLLRQQDWGTGSVLAKTMEIAGELGLKTGLLAQEIDIDTVTDIRNLCAFLATGGRKREQGEEVYNFFQQFIK